MPAIKREFLGSTPAINAAVAWMVDFNAYASHVSSGSLDQNYSSAACVLPGSRAGRFFLRALVEQHDRALIQPPMVLTPGGLRELVADPAGPAGLVRATATERTFAWIAALRAHDDALRALSPDSSADDGALALRALAVRFMQLADELAGARRSFGDVARSMRAQDRLSEEQRWSALATLEEGAIAWLAQHGLDDPSMRTGTAAASDFQITRPEVRRIVVCGVVDLNALQRTRLEAAVSAGMDVTVLIHDEESRADRYDEFGCVVPDAWSAASIGISSDAIHICSSAHDQAQAVLDCAHDRSLSVSGTVTIGLVDTELLPSLQRAAMWAGGSFHSGEGIALEHTPPVRLLDALVDWCDGRGFGAMASLVRHPDVDAALLRTIGSDVDAHEQSLSDWLTLMDKYYNDTLHGQVTGEWLSPRRDASVEGLRRVYDALVSLTEPLSGGDRSFGAWASSFLDVLGRVYAADESEGVGRAPASITEASCRMIASAIDELVHSNAGDFPDVGVVDGLRWLRAVLAGGRVAPEPRSDALELPGWLELVHDPGDSVVLAGMNDGVIPEHVQADDFLPNTMRKALGLVDDARRTARDLCLFDTLVRTKASVTVVCTRVGANDGGLMPSRLLLACSSEERRHRLRRFTSSPETSHMQSNSPVGLASPTAMAQFDVPDLPTDLVIPDRMSVTSFAEYLRCPYRFALKYVLRLASVTDDIAELDAMSFGTLAHDILQKFGEDESVRASTDADAIERFLVAALEARGVALFGHHPSPAVRVQLLQLQRRFTMFARIQAQEAADGWKILHTELKLEDAPPLRVEGLEPMKITGIVDRIDVREHEGGLREFRILDYKTSKRSVKPEAAHRTGSNDRGIDGWSNLQLPLYHKQATAMLGLPPDSTALGYFNLGDSEAGVRVQLAKWEREDLDAAIDVAREVVRRVRGGQFEIQERRVRNDGVDGICLAGVR